MRLAAIWNAQSAFSALSALKKPPKLSYRLYKYQHKFNTEVAICEAQRIKCVCEVAGVEPGSVEAASVVLLPGTPEFVTFLAKFNEFIAGESDLAPVGVGMDALIDALDAETPAFRKRMDALMKGQGRYEPASQVPR